VQLKSAKATDVARLLNAMFNPANGTRPGNGQQRLYADADERTNTVVVTGPTDQVKQAREMIDNVEQPPDLPTAVFFIAKLKAAKAADVATKFNAHFTTTKPGASTGPAIRGGGNGPQINQTGPYCVANPETNSVLVTCDTTNEKAVRAFIQALDEAAARGVLHWRRSPPGVASITSLRWATTSSRFTDT